MMVSSLFAGCIRERIRVLAVLAVVIFLTTPSFVSGAEVATADDSPATVQFLIHLDESLAGGQWLLTTQTGSTETEVKVLGAGAVPPDGRVVVALTGSDVVGASTSRFFIFRAARPVDTSEVYYSVGSVGLTADQILKGSTVDLGSPPAERVALLPVGTELQSRPLPDTPSIEPRLAANGPAPEESITVPEAFSGQPAPEVPAPTPLIESGALPAAPCATEPGGCPPLASSQVTATQYCTAPGGSGFWQDCLLDAQNAEGVRSFRGQSHRPMGTRNRFIVEASNEQSWQNGYRAGGGNFYASGGTTRANGLTQEDGFARQGDCANYNGVFHPDPLGLPCSPASRVSKWGNDTWRWERHRISICLVVCRTLRVEEWIREKQYDGGQREDGPPESVNYYAPTSSVEANKWGSWARYNPDATLKRVRLTGSTTEYSVGAQMTVNFPGSFGEASFTSTVTNNTLQKISNEMEFRSDSDAEAFTQPQPGVVPSHLGYWLRYDNRTSWKAEYWTCRYASGWGGGLCSPG